MSEAVAFSDEDKIIQAEDHDLVRQGAWLKAAEIYQQAAGQRDDWRLVAWYLKRAIARYSRICAWNEAMNCHEVLRAKIPPNLPAPLRLDAWCPTGVALSYGHCAQENVVLRETGQLWKQMEGQWSIYGRYIYHSARFNALITAARWQEAIPECTIFLEWATGLNSTSEELYRLTPSIDEGEEPDLSGESGRWYCVITVLTEKLLPAERQLSLPIEATFKHIEQALNNYKAYCESRPSVLLGASIERIVVRVGTCLSKAGIAATQSGLYEWALEWFQEEERLTGYLYGEVPIYKAAALLSVGAKEAALQGLQSLAGEMVTDGKARSLWLGLHEFDVVRGDQEFRDIVSTWQ